MNAIHVGLASLAWQVAGAPPAGGSDPPKLDPMQLVLHASIPVKLVIVVLAAFSLLCWVVIFAKALHIARARSDSEKFMKAFDSAGTLEGLAQQGLSAFRGSPFARIFATGYDEMVRLTKGERGRRLDEAQGVHVESITRRAAAAEITHLESWMSLLGTIGSTAPFIGLFGTVYGIMDAFLSIGNQQSANLPVVAPKIAEALIATAIGLVAAIPSVMAYNFFARRVGELADVMDSFAADVASRAKLGGITVGMGGGGGGRRRGRMGGMNEINVTPLIDVMLVLLVIFMVTAPLLTTGVQVNLPKVKSAPMQMDDAKLLVIITADEHVYLGKDEITQSVEDKLKTNARLQEEKELYVQADENVKYGAVLRVMAAARGAGVEKLGMITDPMVVK